jgi:large subunit ribosomal protein L29
MKANALKDMTPEALQKELLNVAKEQFNLAMQKATGRLTRTHQLKKVRRDIARIKTILSQKAGEQHG